MSVCQRLSQKHMIQRTSYGPVSAKSHGAKRRRDFLTTKPRLLVADSRPLIRIGFKTVAEQAGFVLASEATHSQEILPKLAAEPIDVVVIDPVLPGRGLDLVPDLKKHHPNTGVLVYTNSSQQHLGVAAIKCGADGFLIKEASLDQLLRALEKLTRGEQYIPDSLANQLAACARSASAEPPHHQLSGREHQIFLRVCDGAPLKQIAGELGIGAKTVTTYRARILQKMGMGSNAELVQYRAILAAAQPVGQSPQ